MGVFRFFYTSTCCREVNKSALAHLRKKTGYTFANIRKALQLHNNDADKAEEWLKEQAKALGWSAALKVQNRQTAQGLIGVAFDKKKVAMVEVNCETDFVSRNEKFRSLVELVTTTCLQYPVLSPGMDVNQVLLTQEELEQLKPNGGDTLADHLALLIGSIGENMTVRRAFCYETSREDINIGIGVHPTPDPTKVLMGKYGSFISFQRNTETSLNIKITSEEVGKELCKHIIGMNPTKIGDENDKRSTNPDDETAMIHQEFLSDQSISVGQFLMDSGTTILDFKRFECGELINTNTKESPKEDEEKNVNVAEG